VMASLTIFANFRINDQERLRRMKDSLQSFKDIAAQKWVVNARGKYKWEAMFYLHEQLGSKLVPYMLESKQGWFHDSRQMLQDISTDYVLFWIEDHMSMIKPEVFSDILREMKEREADYLIYTWFGLDLMSCFEGLDVELGEHIDVIKINKKALRVLKNNHADHYLISCVGIFSKSLFSDVMWRGRPWLPRWPKETPFDFEKKIDDLPNIVFRHAFAKYEVFASIDDNKGSAQLMSLQARGLYPRRVVRKINEKQREMSWAARVWLGVCPVWARRLGRRIGYIWK